MDSLRGLRDRPGLAALGIFILGTLGVLELNDSPFLPAVHSDSVYYMEAGRSLASGEGLAIPISSWSSPDSVATLAHFPPGESVAISGVMKLAGVRPEVAALWVLALSAGLTLAGSFLITTSVGGWGAGLLAVVLLAVMPPFVRFHTAIWSEPLYLPFLLLTLAAMMHKRERVLPGALASLLSLTVRFLGAANVAAVGVWTVLKGAGWKKGAAAALPGTLGFAAWWVWTRTEGSAVRTVGEFDVGFRETVRQLPEALQFWLAPNLPLALAAVLLLGIIAAFLKGPRNLVRPVTLLVASHLLVIVVSRIFLDQRIPFDTRMLLPVLVLAMLPVAASLGRKPRWGLLVALPWILLVGREDLMGIRSLHQFGQYYSSVEWITSDLVEWAQSESHPYRIYSNEPGMMVQLGGRHAKLLPLKTQDMDAFVAAWEDRPGAIVIAAPLRPDEWPPEVFQQRLPVRPVLADQRSVVLVPEERTP